jgi:hypothetical protein
MVPTLRQRIVLPTIGHVKSNGSNRNIEAIELELGPNGKVNIDFDDSTTAATATKNSGASSFAYTTRLNPEEYQYARKKLKKASLEHYR